MGHKTFTIPRKPKPKQSVRAKIKDGRVFAYPDPKVKAHEALIRLYIRKAWGALPCLTGDVSLRIWHRYPWPKSVPKRERKPEGRAKVTRPDLDNLCKMILDAMKGVVFVDDALVAEQSSRKTEGLCETAHTEVEVVWEEEKR